MQFAYLIFLYINDLYTLGHALRHTPPKTAAEIFPILVQKIFYKPYQLSTINPPANFREKSDNGY